jgi:ATP-dependent helicase/DNAse subunit B
VTARILLAPASSGKTGYVLNLARDVARDLQSIPRVVVPTHLQVRACRRRLAEVGGAIGVRVLTFDRLYAECLSAAGETYTELSDPVQYRLIRAVVDGLPLTHYAPLTDRPGFIQVLEGLIGELKAARVWPEAFTEAVAALGDEPRLRELAHIYAAYQARLQALLGGSLVHNTSLRGFGGGIDGNFEQANPNLLPGSPKSHLKECWAVTSDNFNLVNNECDYLFGKIHALSR